MNRTNPFLRFLPALAAAFVAAAASAADPGQVERALDAYTLHDVQGRPAQPADWQGDVVVVNFWATWCKPCRKEMPLLDELHSRMTPYRGRVAAVSVDRDAARVEDFLREHALSLPVYVDGPEGLAKTLDLSVLPYTVVLDRSGRVVHAGAVTPDGWAEFVQMVDRLLGDGQPTAAGVKS